MRVIGPEAIETAAEAIEAGGLVVVPTSRWYMVCADASNEQACDKIIKGKRRPSGKPLVYVAASPDSCQDHFAVSQEAKCLAAALWPGDLAMLLPWKAPEEAVRNTAVGSPALVTVAPGVLGKLASTVGVPLAGTTANISGDGGPNDPGPAITVDQVRSFLTDSGLAVDFVVDGGVCPAANHMTIVDCSTQKATLVRAGLVHERAVSAVLNDLRNA